MRTFLFFCLVGVFSYVNAQTEMPDPVKWTFSVEKIEEGTYKLIYQAEIEEGWAIYSRHIDEGGPIPTTFTIEDSDGVELIGEAVEPTEVESKFDELFEMDVIKIKGSPIFYQIVKSTADVATVKGFVEFMSCDATKCLPPTMVDFEISVE